MGKTQAHSSPRIRSYVAVFAVLAVLTAVEVGVTYLPIPRVPVLVPLALFKAALVVLFYMHVRYDRKIFGLIFAMGLLMGVGLILSLLALISAPLIQTIR
jgi:cytochrome c oxidase subunit IV